jgi:hypothetical protein
MLKKLVFILWPMLVFAGDRFREVDMVIDSLMVKIDSLERNFPDDERLIERRARIELLIDIRNAIEKTLKKEKKR